MIEQSKIAASVTLYNSPVECLMSIETYRTQVAMLYVVDNSEGKPGEAANRLMNLPNVVYMPNNGNQGVGVALNRAAEAATADGFDFLLTMDDDTAAPANLVDDMGRFLTYYPNADQVGIVSASHTIAPVSEPFRSVLTTMTSGNLLNLSIYAKVGPFRDDFFIDHVDHEYGLRLNQAAYQVIELPGLQLTHQLGERKSTGWRGQTYVSHAPVRGYYIVRNGIVLMRDYGAQFPTFRKRVRSLLTKEVLKALLFEDQKLQRLKLLWRGLLDGRSGRLGKLGNLA